MSLMKCDTCETRVDTDEHPLSMYATEDLGVRKPNGQPFDCLCADCWNTQEQMGFNRRSGR